MMRWFEDADSNFVEQFQTTGFDARIWELYLFTALSEAGYKVDRSRSAPDFTAKGLFGEFCVEAATVNPSLGPDGRRICIPEPSTQEERMLFERDYLPIRFAGPLTTKLDKRYWEQPHVTGKPLVFAIRDFHAPLSMTWSRSGLPTYLYGYLHHPRREEDESLTIVPGRVKTHRWRGKEIPSGFFDLPGAENVSAVLFSNSGTLLKFNRIGVVAGFGSGQVILVRRGAVIDHDPRASVPRPFLEVVNEEYTESWMEGMDVYHNPQAKHPLDSGMLRGAAHHHLLSDGQVETVAPAWHPVWSVTSIMVRDARGRLGPRR